MNKSFILIRCSVNSCTDIFCEKMKKIINRIIRIFDHTLIIPEGSILTSISSKNDSNKYIQRNRWMYLFDSSLDYDRWIYEGLFAAGRMEKKSDIYEHTFTVTHDLRMPSEEYKRKILKNNYGRKRDQCYDLLVELSKFYDATKDDVDLRTLKTISPILVFNPFDSLKPIKEPRIISEQEIIENWHKLKSEDYLRMLNRIIPVNNLEEYARICLPEWLTETIVNPKNNK